MHIRAHYLACMLVGMSCWCRGVDLEFDLVHDAAEGSTLTVDFSNTDQLIGSCIIGGEKVPMRRALFVIYERKGKIDITLLCGDNDEYGLQIEGASKLVYDHMYDILKLLVREANEGTSALSDNALDQLLKEQGAKIALYNLQRFASQVKVHNDLIHFFKPLLDSFTEQNKEISTIRIDELSYQPTIINMNKMQTDKKADDIFVSYSSSQSPIAAILIKEKQELIDSYEVRIYVTKKTMNFKTGAISVTLVGIPAEVLKQIKQLTKQIFREHITSLGEGEKKTQGLALLQRNGLSVQDIKLPSKPAKLYNLVASTLHNAGILGDALFLLPVVQSKQQSPAHVPPVEEKKEIMPDVKQPLTTLKEQAAVLINQEYKEGSLVPQIPSLILREGGQTTETSQRETSEDVTRELVRETTPSADIAPSLSQVPVVQPTPTFNEPSRKPSWRDSLRDSFWQKWNGFKQNYIPTFTSPREWSPRNKTLGVLGLGAATGLGTYLYYKYYSGNR
jgi:hypothetical protein